MSRKKKPFELYSTALPDGRRVVRVIASEPAIVTIWLVAASKSEALRHVREVGALSPHVDSDLRPLGHAVYLAGASPDGGIFAHEYWWSSAAEKKYFPLSDLPAYLARHSDSR